MLCKAGYRWGYGCAMEMQSLCCGKSKWKGNTEKLNLIRSWKGWPESMQEMPYGLLLGFYAQIIPADFNHNHRDFNHNYRASNCWVKGSGWIVEQVWEAIRTLGGGQTPRRSLTRYFRDSIATIHRTIPYLIWWQYPGQCPPSTDRPLHNRVWYKQGAVTLCKSNTIGMNLSNL